MFLVMFCQRRFFRTFSVSADLAAKYTLTVYQVTCCQDRTVSIIHFDLGIPRSNNDTCTQIISNLCYKITLLHEKSARVNGWGGHFFAAYSFPWFLC